MREKLIILGMIFICLILQYTVMPAIAIASIAPNLMVSFVVAFGLMRGNRDGMLIGFVSGLLMDAMFMMLDHYVLGFRAIIFMFIGYTCGYCYRIFYDDDVKMPVILTAAADFVYGIIMYVSQFLLRGRLDFLYYLRRFILPEMIYTILMTLIFYRLFLFINRKIERAAKRSVDSFV